jgi:hypothetical protein
MGYEKGIGAMRNRVHKNYTGMQLDRHKNYCATRVQLQYGNAMN